MGEFAHSPLRARAADLATRTGGARTGARSARGTRTPLSLPQTIGNQGMQRLLQVKSDNLQPLSGTKNVTPIVPDLSQISVPPKSLGTIQAKLEVSPPGDIYEQEADRVSEQVTRVPEPQREHVCSCGGLCPECQSEQPDHENPLQAKRFEPSDLGQTAVPPIVHEVLRSPGQTLDLAARSFMEQRFGHDFSHVRVHTDPRAADSAQAVEALAYTVGWDVVFGAGQYAPESVEGRWLLAHELTHTLQQSRGSHAIQRFVPCSHARLSLEECPRREPGEESESRHGPMIVEFITRPEVGYLIGNFGVGQSTLKASAKTHPNWSQLIRTVSQAGSQWRLLGLSDCHGKDQLNKSLRQQRADAVRAALPPAAAAHVIGASGASLEDCITDNTTQADRAWNRAVLITAEVREMEFEPHEIEGKRPVPKPVDRPTVDCTDSEEKEIAQAQSIAVEMVREALYVVRTRKDPAVQQLLRKYFNEDSDKTHDHVHAGLLNILKGLRSGLKVECEHRGSFMYGHFCEGILGYARHPLFALRVHLCEDAFGRSDLDLAWTLIHEFSHLSDWTSDKEYCNRGCSRSLDPEDAYDNADSYAGFAHDAYVKL